MFKYRKKLKHYWEGWWVEGFLFNFYLISSKWKLLNEKLVLLLSNADDIQ